jgi:hypothetical protein
MDMPVDERRLTSRVLGIWNALPRDHDLPRRSALIPDALGRDSADCLLVAIDAVLARSRLIYIGEMLRNPAWSAGQPQDLLAYAAGSLVRLAAAKIPAIVAKRAPITFGGTGVHDDKAILYRTILLPLSEDGEIIDHVIGAINFREIADSEEHPLDEAGPPVTRETTEKVSAYLAFSGRRVSFAPRTPAAVTTS